jgi:hypothetical protein
MKGPHSSSKRRKELLNPNTKIPQEIARVSSISIAQLTADHHFLLKPRTKNQCSIIAHSMQLARTSTGVLWIAEEDDDKWADSSSLGGRSMASPHRFRLGILSISTRD